MQLTTIQAGRGVAALAVVFFHLSVIMGQPQYGGEMVFHAWTWRGNVGVDFFFVLSGFIMMFVHQQDIGRPERWTRYAYARFVRLYPIYWLYTGVFCAAALAGIGASTQLPTTIEGWISSLTLIRLTTEAAPLGVAWTLFHEIAFYAVFSVLIMNRRIGIALLTVWMLAVAYRFDYPPTDHPTPIQTYFAAYNLDFILGIAACLIMRSASSTLANGAFWAGTAILAVTLTYEYSVQALWWNGLAYGIAFSGIIAGMATWEARRGTVSIPFAKQLGDASYTIYLLHVPIIAASMKVIFASGLGAILGGPATFGITLLCVIFGGLLAHMVAEKPIQRIFKRKSPSRQSVKHVQSAI